jgi:hypothetical protein
VGLLLQVVISYYQIVTEMTIGSVANRGTIDSRTESIGGSIMSSRIRRDHPQVTPATVVKDDVPTVVRPEPLPAQPGSSELPYVEPEEYGLRVDWQSEPAGRDNSDVPGSLPVQESSSRRLARVMARMRDQLRSERGTTEPDA